MKKKHSTKKALIASVLMLCLCITSLVGTTFAWFTDEVTSANNIIQTGKLDVAMYWFDGTKAVPADDSTDWTDASAGAIFDYDLWEPGYVSVRHIKIANEGSLALKYMVRFVANGEVSELADVIDVYYVDPAAQIANRTELTADKKIGTLTQVLANLGESGNGVLAAGESDTITLALKMQESAGNEYQNLSIGSSFSIQLLATQYTAENDSFDDQYDADATYMLADGTLVTETENGGLALYSVKNVDEETYYVPDGITEIGDYAFTSNSAIKEVVLPDTVTSLGRGFDSNTTIEKVVLNDGLETIDSRAFRATTALEEVVIPSTVKTIADNAFQKTSLKRIVIPATVETIGETAFGASLIEEVVFEGNTSIQGYAFRGCTQLRTVYMYGDDIQFIPSTLNGRNSCWFCNGESNNPNTSDIDFHVANDVMKERVLTAMGAERNNTDVYVDINIVNNDAALSDAIANSSASNETETIILASGTYSNGLDLTVTALGAAKNDTLVFKAASGSNVVFSGTTTLGYRNQGVGAEMYEANVVFEGITFDARNGNVLDIGDVASITLKDCTIIGDGDHGISARSGNATGPSQIINCTFENAAIQGYGNFCTGLVIDGCTFNNSKVNIQGGNGVTIKNSVFNNTLTESNIDDSFYAIRSNSTPITVENCEFNVDSELTEVVTTAQAKWYLLANRGTTNWSVNNVAVTLSDAALAQTQLKITACTSSGVINTTNFKVNGVQQ